MPRKVTSEERKEMDTFFAEYFPGFSDKVKKPSPPGEGEIPCPKCDGQGILRIEEKVLFFWNSIKDVQCSKCGGIGKIKA